MPQFQTNLILPTKPSEVFDLLTKPESIAQLSPPDRPIELVKGPKQVEAGSVLFWRGKRWGMAHNMIVEVVEFVPNERILWQQQRGTLKTFRHEQRFTTMEGGMQLEDEITFAPPGGILGLTVTEKVVLMELTENFRYRDDVLREMFSK